MAGKLQLRFSRAQYVFRVFPAAGGMPLRLNMWRYLYEGYTEGLDLRYGTKGFVFISDSPPASLFEGQVG
jgi:hypothetical protein